jgi:hypothetical protein
MNEQIQNYFKEHGYVVIRKFLTPDIASLLYSYCITTVQRTDFMISYDRDNHRPTWDGTFGDAQASECFNRYGDPMMDTLLAMSKQSIENYTGLTLSNNYTYWRFYQKNNDLLRHRDRHSCEISTTLCLGYDVSNVDKEMYPNYTWPMWVEDKDNPNGIPVQMESGDMIIYRGCDVDHWREKFKGLSHAQVFMHYNDVNGPFNIVNDGRPILGIPKTFQSINQ